MSFESITVYKIHPVVWPVKHIIYTHLKQHLIKMPTSKATRAGNSLTSSDKQSSAFDARISFVKSTWSHQRSSALSIDTVLPSSGVSIFIRQTDDGTSTATNAQQTCTIFNFPRHIISKLDDVADPQPNSVHYNPSFPRNTCYKVKTSFFILVFMGFHLFRCIRQLRLQPCFFMCESKL